VLRNLLLGLPSGLAAPERAIARQMVGLPARIKEGQATLREMEAWYLEHVMKTVHGNVAGAARILGVDRTTITRKLKAR